MNLSVLLTACRKALFGDANWAEDIEISSRGVTESFLAAALSVPALYICAVAIARERAKLSDASMSLVPVGTFATVALIYLLSFSTSAYIICAAFKKTECFAPWVISRHWSVFFVTFMAASLYGLYLMGVMPFLIANSAALLLYLGTLLIDIRLAQLMGRFDVTAAIFTACIIFAMGLSVLLMGVVQLGGAA